MRSRLTVVSAAGLVALMTLLAGCIDAFRTYDTGQSSGPPTWNGGPGKTSIKDLIASPGAHCLNCHTAPNGSGYLSYGYSMETYALTTGVDKFGGTPIVKGQPDSSVLIWRLEGSHLQAPMPLDGWIGESDRAPMAPTEFVEIFRTWVANGAPED